MKKQYIFLCTILTAGALLFGSLSCKKKTEPEDIEIWKKEALQQYAIVVQASYDDSFETAESLRDKIVAFLANPTESGFESCKSAWLAARNPYGQTEAYRFYSGPIDDGDGPEGLLNAWPMDESFVDYVAGNPTAGVINKPATYPNITKELIVGLNELFSEQSIFCGFHAAEFLLWGQDLSTTGPGTRPFTDYAAGGTSANQDRRGTYLTVVANLILEHLESVRAEWRTSGAYYNEFINLNPAKKSMGLIFSGLEAFTYDELAGERMFVAIDLGDQEHEHSCFSDNTIADIKMNLLGVRNVYFGSYTDSNGFTVSGRSFDELATRLAPDKAAEVRAAFTLAETKVNAIPAPFDQSIQNEKAKITEAIEALRALGIQLAEVGVEIGAEF
ncbi:MAG: peptidase M75 [Saprospiraceae bacterium]|nr:peptidase M75 [Saprospiraceae bacterium]